MSKRLQHGSIRKNMREERAFSLVSVVVLGMVATMWLLASYSAIYSVYYQVNSSKFDLVLRNCAEAGLDYVTKRIGEGISNPPAWEKDDTVADTTYSTFILSPSDLGIQDGQNERVRLKVTIKNLEVPGTSYLGDYFTLTMSPSTVIGSSGVAEVRVVEIRAYFESDTALVSNPVKKFYRSVIGYGQPTWDVGDNSGGSGAGASYFLFPAFGSRELVIGANSDLLEDSDGRGTIGANASERESNPDPYKNVPFRITGDNVYANTAVAIASENANETAIGALSTSSEKGSKVDLDTLRVNGKAEGFYASEQGEPPNNTEVKMPGPNPITQQDSSVVPHPMAPAPAAPGNAGDLGAISLSGSSSLRFTQFPSSPNDIGPASDGSFNFRIDSITMLENSSISVADNVSGPIRLFVEGPSLEDSAINLGGKANLSGTSSAKVQIFYNGTKPVNLVNNKFEHAGLYAPNAKVTIGSSLRPTRTELKGSAIGRSLSAENSKLEFEKIDGGDGNGGGGLPNKNDLNPNSSSFGPDNLDAAKNFPLARKTWEEMSYSEYLNKKIGPPF